MKDSSYRHVCTIVLGVATLFRFIGYDIATFIIESLVHSAHIRDPGAIMAHAGYYGQAVKEISTCISTFIVPVFLNYVSPKWTLVIGSALFACYFGCFFFINNFLYFLANILLGLAFALIYTSFSTCQMAFSTSKTLARNSARIQGVANLSLISGGLLYIYITSTHVENSVSSENPHQKLEFGKQLKATVSTLIDPHILLFVPRFLNHGLLVSFFMNVYPTSLQYSTILAQEYPMMTAYYAFAMCAGTTLCGFVVSPLNRYFNDFGLRPLYYITAGIQIIAYSIAVLTVPNLSTARPTDESAFFEPSLFSVCLMAFLLGFADSTNAASCSVVCSRLLPGRASHTYSSARFYRGVAASAIFFCSPILSMQSHAIILITVTLISALSFDFAVKQIEKRAEERIPHAKQIDA